MMRARTPLLRLACLASLPLLAACDGGTEPLRPASFEVIGSGQSATVATPVPTAPAVRVLSSGGRPVPGVDAVFTVSRGGGSVIGAAQTSGSDGVARLASWTLGTAAVENELTVTSTALRNGSATITAQALADVPAALTVTVQPSGSAANGAPLPVQPVVQLADRFGNPSPRSGVTVTAYTSGNISILNGTQQTDAAGTAAFRELTLRGVSGSYVLQFKADGLGDAVASSTFLVAGAAHHLAVTAAPTGVVFRGNRLVPAFEVRVVDEQGNYVTSASPQITATLAAGSATLGGTTTLTANGGSATFTDLVISDTGSYRIRFTASALGEALSDPIQVVAEVAGSCAAAGDGAFALDLALGETVRRLASAANAPTCLEFDTAHARGHQYLVMFENLPMSGPNYDQSVFPGLAGTTMFQFAVRSQPASFAPASAFARRGYANALLEPEPSNEWDFGDGRRIREGRVEVPAEGVAHPKLLRAGALVDLSAAAAHPVVGDTVVVQLQGIPRLGIPTAEQQAVVRYISDHLIFAEDVRLPTLVREGGGTNTPLPLDTMRAIADEYARFASVQGDLLFEGRHNNWVETWGTPPKVLAVHTLMYANNIWGYTYPNRNFFAYDYWVGTSGSGAGCTASSPCLAQRAQRVADNLFMHEIAHMRHHGLLERAGRTGARGNQWLVEGFARFTERLPIANRLLGPVTPSRTGNVVLPYNTTFNNRYFYDDVPTYLSAGLNMFGGYGASAYVFDYFADQVARAGGDPIAALRDFLVNGGTQATLDEAVSRWLPGLGFGDLFTLARIALYADDYGPGLLDRTQYLQFQLRASRPPGSNSPSDPRNAWLKLAPGRPEIVDPVPLDPGTARGVVIDGTAPQLGSAQILLDVSKVPNGVVSITRIR